MASMQKCWIVICVLAVSIGHAWGDCYPGDETYTSIVQEIYHMVTSDNIVLDFHGSHSMTRQALCSILTSHHNSGTNPGQSQTNKEFLGLVTISQSDCTDALTYTKGYDSISGWQQWAGYHSGTWYPSSGASFSDGAMWHEPYYKPEPEHLYVVQSVRFDSAFSSSCHTNSKQTGSETRYGWNQSGEGVLYIWGWDPKDNICYGGRRGTHVGFPFSVGPASCIVWVTTEEAFLECLTGHLRTSATSGSGDYEGYGQWTLTFNFLHYIANL